jgi:transcriptional regulator with XRE-family HTH domain
MAFAENLRRVRLEQFLSQAELARRAGLHALTVRIEGDELPLPHRPAKERHG